MNVKAMEFEPSRLTEKDERAKSWGQEIVRYRIVDSDTGKILDDAQGWGYKTAQNAYAAWGHKNRDKSKDAAKAAKRKGIREWMRQHEDFVDAMDQSSFEIAKGSWGPDEKFNADFVRKMLKAWSLDPPFSAGELLRTWERTD